MSGSAATTVIVGGDVLIDDRLVPAEVVLADGRIVAVEQRSACGVARSHESVVDATGAIVAPGFVDLQINGGWGHDFTSDPASIAAVARSLPSTGVTAFAPTIVSSSAGARSAALDALGRFVVPSGVAVPIGLHLEGPAISPDRPGAHVPGHIGLPDRAEWSGWTRDRGVAVVTLAPEIDGTLDMIRALRAGGVVVSIGHTECTAQQFADAVRAGASMVTHLYNAMSPFGHRDPGPVGATLADERVAAGLICDGIHVDAVAVRAAWRALGASRFVLVTDAMAALGAAETQFELGGVGVSVDHRGVRTPDGVLAGSDLALDRAVRNLMRFTGCPAAEALRAASTTPAMVAGLHDRGRIVVGARADLVLLDADLTVTRTIIGGATAWKS